MQPMCVLRTQLTTAVKATMLQTKSSSATSSLNNLMVSWMAFAKPHIYEQSKHTCLEITCLARTAYNGYQRPQLQAKLQIALQQPSPSAASSFNNMAPHRLMTARK